MKAEELLAKAFQASASARLLLDAGDTDGASNRAYYAMFDAARSALLICGHDFGKTHKGVLNAFSEHLVKSGLLPKEMGRLLKHAETFRYIADYDSDSVEPNDARDMVQQAETFVETLNSTLFSAENSPPNE